MPANLNYRQTSITIADLWRPGSKSLAGLYDISLILCGSVLLGLSAQIAVGWPVPFTMQTFAVLMIGALFGGRLGSLTVLAYLIEGAVGLPVFSLGRGGLSVLFGPTGGYLFGFIAAAYVTGLLAENRWDRQILTTIAAMIIGNLVIYCFGLLWLTSMVGLKNALMTGIYPFIAGDLIKIGLAAALLPSGWKLLRYFDLIDENTE
jgi:biotin transport system substrate-specific component